MNKTTRLIHLVILLGLMLALTTTQASAALVRCRVDPIFVLSNGDVVTVTVDISTDPASVRDVTYILHVPAGVTVKQVAHTARGLRLKEITKVYQDSPTGTYTTDTVVTTRNPSGSVAVISYTRMNGIPTQAIFGYDGQHLVATISRQ